MGITLSLRWRESQYSLGGSSNPLCCAQRNGFEVTIYGLFYPPRGYGPHLLVEHPVWHTKQGEMGSLTYHSPRWALCGQVPLPLTSSAASLGKERFSSKRVGLKLLARCVLTKDAIPSVGRTRHRFGVSVRSTATPSVAACVRSRWLKLNARQSLNTLGPLQRWGTPHSCL